MEKVSNEFDGVQARFWAIPVQNRLRLDQLPIESLMELEVKETVEQLTEVRIDPLLSGGKHTQSDMRRRSGALAR